MKRLQLFAEVLEDRCVPSSVGVYRETDFVSDQAGVGQMQDANLVNAWGFAAEAGSGNFLVADNGTGVSTGYHGDVLGDSDPGNDAFAATSSPAKVNIPLGEATGAVFNPFNQSNPTEFVIDDGAGHSGP